MLGRTYDCAGVTALITTFVAATTKAISGRGRAFGVKAEAFTGCLAP